MQGTPINWDVRPTDSKILQHPLYIQFNASTFATLASERASVVTAIKGAYASQESASIIAYLSWLLRTVDLVNA